MPPKATYASFAVEEWGFAECNIKFENEWHTGLSYLLLSSLSVAGLAATWWYAIPVLWWSLKPALLRGVLATVGLWAYVHWISPLQYESVAVKRGRGLLEICTHWRLFERSIILPIKDLTAVTLQEVPGHEVRLVFKCRSDKVYTSFKHSAPHLMVVAEIYAVLVTMLPRQIRKGRAVSLMQGPDGQWAISRWAAKQQDFVSSGLACMWSRVRSWSLTPFYALLRLKNRVKNSSTYEQVAGKLGPLAPAWELLKGWAAWVPVVLKLVLSQLWALLGPLLAHLQEGGKGRVFLKHVLQEMKRSFQCEPQRAPSPRHGQGGGSGGAANGGAPGGSGNGAYKRAGKSKGKGRKR